MIIYKQYDQAALDRQYNNRIQVPEWADHLERWARTSRYAERNYSPVNNIAYGEGKLENLDIYPSRQPGSKVLLFIHGGYWHKLDKSDFHFVGSGFHSYNLTTVIINYPLAPLATMDEIVLSCRKAMSWVNSNIATYNGDPDRVYIAGHSAGGHLAAMMMTAETIMGVKGVCVMSGLFNLEPIRLSEINEVLHLDDQMVLRNSPVKLKPVLSCPLVIAVGGNEADEYKEQSGELLKGWKEDIPVILVELAGANHYSIIEEAVKPEKEMHRQMKKLLGV
jgi:arylformamidase